VNGLTHAVERLGAWSMAQWDWEIARALLGALGRDDWPDIPPAPELGHLCAGGNPKENRITIHAGSKWDYTRWPLERYVGLAGRLARDHEVIWVDRPETHPRTLPPGVTTREAGSLAELVSLLNSSHLFVGNNSGPMHLASALGTPSVILSGPTHPGWDPQWNRERFLVLRQTGLPCQPCDGLPVPAYVCRLPAEPQACLRRWEVDVVEERCRDWLRSHDCRGLHPARS
jgi:ADP-heptose:LPS heptosyltransferase